MKHLCAAYLLALLAAIPWYGPAATAEANLPVHDCDRLVASPYDSQERLSDDRLARVGGVVRRPGAQAEEPPYAPSSAPPVITGPRLSGPAPAGLISIQLAAVSDPTSVDPALARLGKAARGVRADIEVSVRPPPEGGRWWRLLAGPFEDEAAARAACRALAAVSPDCWLPRDL